MDYKEFFNQHPVFTIEELCSVFKKQKRNSIYNNLKYYLKKKKVRHAKRGVYYVIPDASSPDKYCPDSILLASRLSKDSVLAFHSALEIMGYAHSVFHRFFYYSNFRKRKFSFRSDEFINVKIPVKLQEKRLELLGIEEKGYHNLPVKFTNRERTFVDCLDRPRYAGGIEEVYRCIEKYPYLNFEEIMAYLDALGKGILYAKVGFFLEQHRDKFFVEKNLLEKLRNKKSYSTVYFDSRRKKGKLVKEWNLIVPEIIIKRSWEEF